MHNTRKKHKKHTQKRARNKRSRAHKHKLRRTRYNKRHNITHKQRGGISMPSFPRLFGSSDADKTVTQNAQENVSLGKSSQKNANIIKGVAKVSLASTVAKVAVVGLSASGVGVPLAGVIATALVIAHVFAEMKISNIHLRTVIYDTLNIVSNCYILNDYIEFIEYHMKTYSTSASSVDNTTDTVNQHNDAINDLKDRLKTILEELIAYLLSIATEEMLNSLDKSPSATPAIKNLINTEFNNRNKWNIINIGSRVVNRTIKADRTIGYIIRDLSIMNGFFMLIKSHFDFSVNVFERSLTNDDVINFWNVVATSGDISMDENNKPTLNEATNPINNPYTRYLHGNTNKATDAAEDNARKVDQTAITLVDTNDEDTSK
jgi:hypothetical protein